MKTPWAAIKDFFAAFRGGDPVQQGSWIPPYPLAGIRLTPDQSLSLSTVWACIDIIAKNIASCDWFLYEPIPNTKRRKRLDSDWKTWMLNTRPNPEMTAIGFREAMLFQAIPYGNSYAEIVPDLGGRVREMWPLLSDRMTPRRNPQTWALEYHYTQPNGELVVFKPNQIFHLRGPGLWGLMGDSIIARAAKTLALAAAQERYSSSFFGQGAQPIGVLKYPNKLTPEVHKRLKDDWTEKYKGPDNAHKPLILEGGMSFEAISIDPQKSQLVDQKKFSVEEICRWFGVPPHKVQHLEHATFSNIEHSSIEFVRDSLRPWSKRLSQEADAKLFDQNRGPWKYTEIDLAPLMRGDAASRAAAAASFRQNGIKSANEIRSEEGLDDCGDEGDVLLVQSNLTTVDRIVDPPERPAFPPRPIAPGEEDDDEETPDAIRRAAISAALQGVMDRYGRRLKNRLEAVKSKPISEDLIKVFKKEQHEVLLTEMSPFNEFSVQLFGRSLTVEDMAKASAMYERGEGITGFIRELPSQLSTPKEKVST